MQNYIKLYETEDRDKLATFNQIREYVESNHIELTEMYGEIVRVSEVDVYKGTEKIHKVCFHVVRFISASEEAAIFALLESKRYFMQGGRLISKEEAMKQATKTYLAYRESLPDLVMNIVFNDGELGIGYTTYWNDIVGISEMDHIRAMNT